MKAINHAYQDLDFNFIAHPITGDVSKKTDGEAVRQSIRNIVMTSFYERGFNTDFGCSGVKYQLFDNFSNIGAVELKQDIERAIINFEPRADLVSVEVGFDDHYLQISIKFNILNNDKIHDLFIKIKRQG